MSARNKSLKDLYDTKYASKDDHIVAYTPRIDTSKCPLMKDKLCTFIDPKKPDYRFPCDGSHYRSCGPYLKSQFNKETSK